MNAVVGLPTKLTISTSDGHTLEAEYHLPDDATAVVVLSHPHPQYGGDMYNPLIEQLFRALPTAGVAALRYNFRGVGGSTGAHDNGVGERLDAAAAFKSAATLGVSGPLVSTGWSFGADVSLSVAVDELAAWVAIAAPLAIVDPTEMVAATDDRPTLLLVPEHDQYRSPEAAAEVTADWSATGLITIEGGDHFLTGYSQAVAEQIVAFVQGL